MGVLQATVARSWRAKYTGWMLKKGETGNSWKRRYFACSLADKTLSYYDKPGGKRATLLALSLAWAMVLTCADLPGATLGDKRATLDLSACHDLLELTQDSEPRFIFELQFRATSYHIAACVVFRPCSSVATGVWG